MDQNTTESQRRLNWAEWTGIISFHVLVLFVILNVGIWAVSQVRSLTQKGHASEKAPYKHKEFDPALIPVYPDLNAEQIDQLITDSRRVTQEYESFTQFREIAPYRSKYVNVDEHGIRLSKDQGPWPPSPDNFNVFFFGGSTAFGYGLPDHQTVPSFLQDFLRQDARLPAKVYNFGRASYFSAQERVLLEKLLLGGFLPDMAVFLDGSNEFVFWDHEPGYTGRLKKWLPEGDIPVTRHILRELPVVKLVRNWVGITAKEEAAKESKPHKAESQEVQRWLEETVGRFLRNKRMIEAICKEFRVTPVFVWQPNPLHKYDQRYHIFAQFDYEGFTPLVKPGFDFMAREWKSKPFGNNFIWCADIGEDCREPLYVSAFHYSPKMARMVAGCIFRALAERGFLPNNAERAVR